MKGDTSVNTTGLDTVITATDQSVADYRSFDILANETVEVRITNDVGADLDGGSHLGRINSADPTSIDGKLFSNGHVYLINPAGILFGENAEIDVTGLHASAGSYDETDVNNVLASPDLDERVRYQQLVGKVENLGQITAEVVDLIGRHVVNAGTIGPQGENGFFVLISGSDVTIARVNNGLGDYDVSVTINGLAETLEDALGDPVLTGVEFESDSVIDAGGGELRVGLAAKVGLAAGDLVGTAMQLASGGLTYRGTMSAKNISLISSGADVAVEAAIAATEKLEICAGSKCSGTGSELVVLEDPVDFSTATADVSDPDTLTISDPTVLSGPSVRMQSEGDLSVEGGDLNPDASLELLSAGALDVQTDLSAAELTLSSGTDGNGALILGAVTLRGDQINLSAGDESDYESIEFDEDTKLQNLDLVEEAAPGGLSISQGLWIDESFLTQNSIAGLVVEDQIDLHLRSDRGGILIDLRNLNADEASVAEALLAKSNLQLESRAIEGTEVLGGFILRRAGVEVDGDLVVRSLEVTSGTARSTFSGNLRATEGDIVLDSTVILDGEPDDDVAGYDQSIVAEKGRILLGSPEEEQTSSEEEQTSPEEEQLFTLWKATTGDLLLDADTDSAVDGVSIDLDGDIEVSDGNLTIADKFSMSGAEILVKGDEAGQFVLDQGAVFDRDPTLSQTVNARELIVESSLTKESTDTEFANLALKGSETLSLNLGANIRSKSLRLGQGSVDSQVLIADGLSDADFDVEEEFSYFQGVAIAGAEIARVLGLIGAKTVTIDTPDEMTLDGDVALETSANLILRADSDITVSQNVTAGASLLMHAGEGAITDTQRKLSLVGSADTPVVISADEIELRAGSGAENVPAVVELANVEFKKSDGTARPEELKIHQDAAIDLDDFAGVNADRLVFQSDLGDVVLDSVFDEPEAGSELQLLSNDEVRVSANVNTDRLVTHAGRDGSGNTLIEAGVQLAVRELELEAGNGISGEAAEAEVLVDSAVEFSGLESFSLAQDKTIDDTTHIPNLGVDYDGALELRSKGGSVVVNTIDLIEGTALTLGGREGVEVDSSADTDLVVRELTILDLEPELQLDASAVFHQNVTASEGDITLESNTDFRSPAEAERKLEATSGSITALKDLSFDEGADSSSGTAFRLIAGEDVQSDGKISFQSAYSSSSDPVLSVQAKNITVTDVTTAGLGQSVAPRIELTAEQTLTLAGAISTTGSDASKRGDVTLTSEGENGIRIGRSEPLPDGEEASVVGANVLFDGAVSRTPVLVLEEDTDTGTDTEVDKTDETARRLTVNATGDLEFTSTVDATTLNATASDDIRVNGDLTMHTLTGETATGRTSVVLKAGADGTGNLLLEAGVTKIVADEIDLAAGSSDAESDDIAEISLAAGIELQASDSEADQRRAFARNSGFSQDDVADFLALDTLGDDGVEGMEIQFQSYKNEVQVNGADVTGSELTLGGGTDSSESVKVTGGLDVQKLDLLSNASLDGDLKVSDGGLDTAGDVTVTNGNVQVEGTIGFSGKEGQAVWVHNGSLEAAGGLKSESEDSSDVTVDALGDLTLGDVETTSEAAFVNGGLDLISGEGNIVLAGDVIARRDLILATDVAADKKVLLTANNEQRLLSSEGWVEYLGSLGKEDGSLSVGGEKGFHIGGNIWASQDLVLIGPGMLGAMAERVEAEEGTLVLATNSETRDDLGLLPPEDSDAQSGTPTGGIHLDEDSDGLELRAGDGIEIRGTGETADEILVFGNRIDFASRVSGTGSLEVFAGGIATRDVALDGSTLSLNAGSIEFVAAYPGEVRRIAAGTIALNPQGRDASETPTMGSAGDLELIASTGDLTMGSGEILTAVGKLDVSAAGNARLGSLNAMEIAVNAGSISASGPGTDWNANFVSANQAPVGVTVATPSGIEVSDALVNDSTRRRMLNLDGSELSEDDLMDADSLLDVTATGPVLFEAGRQLEAAPIQVAALPKQVLGLLAGDIALERPLLADELFALLERALAGDSFAQLVEDEPRIEDDPFRQLLQSYTAMFVLGPSAQFDPSTGLPGVGRGPAARGVFAEAIAFYRGSGASFSGADFARHLRSERKGDPADYYLSTLRELLERAEAAGLSGDQLDQFRAILIRDVTPDDVPVSFLNEALLSLDQ
ncbi:MAG: filamentous hemagglutinin N-terminal domain-containing protein [bacterium]|nr:filamentous hemagglutinin N-terminal domain-containing protein [bacterium]